MATKKYGVNELREMFLSFFESKGHLRLPSFSLIPQNDRSLLLINSGMAPMKPYFKGEVEPPRRRVCTCQKCIRTGDIDNIGHTARHGTYFEMLGNFSFGDYFKHEAIAWCWEFLTEVCGLEKERLYPSVYENDDEAFEIWNKEIGIPAERIFRFGKEDNFWEHGSGPCGPCSEVYYDRGEKYGCGKPGCTVGCDCDRYMEIWNNVFSQFDNDGQGNYTDLVQKNIDTGMGLERLAVACQDVDSLFDVDTVMNITNKVTELTGASYGMSHEKDVSLRVITDHIRASTFMIADGVLPSNEGRGYVLRRILRRACRHGRLGRGGRRGRLVYLKPQRVAEGMAEIFAEARVRDDLPRRSVDLSAADTRPCRFYALELGAQDDVIDIFHFLGRVAYRDGARHVRAVAVFEAAEVHGDKVAVFNGLVGGHAVGHAGIRARNGDGVKGVALAAVLEEPVAYLGGYITLRYARADDAQNVVERFFGDSLRRAHMRLLLFVLGSAQLVKYALAGRELQPQQLFVVKILPVRQAQFLRAERLHRAGSKLGLYKLGKPFSRAEEPQPEIRGNGLFGGLDVSGIGEKEGALPRYEHRAVGKGKARRVELVFHVGYQNAVKVFLSELLPNFQKPVQFRASE